MLDVCKVFVITEEEIYVLMVGSTGIEPVTSSMSLKRSNRLS
jgi:hypothetical protein